MFDPTTLVRLNADFEKRHFARLNREAKERIAAVVLSAGGTEETYREALAEVEGDNL